MVISRCLQIGTVVVTCTVHNRRWRWHACVLEKSGIFLLPWRCTSKSRRLWWKEIISYKHRNKYIVYMQRWKRIDGWKGVYHKLKMCSNYLDVQLKRESRYLESSPPCPASHLPFCKILISQVESTLSLHYNNQSNQCPFSLSSKSLWNSAPHSHSCADAGPLMSISIHIHDSWYKPKGVRVYTTSQ